MNRSSTETKSFQEYIKNNGSIRLWELRMYLKENSGFKYKGDSAYTIGNHKNIIFWMGWNEEAFNIVADLKRDG